MNVRNITLLGHKDHGKSTLIGNFLILTNSVSQARIREAEKYSKILHKDFEPAFMLDSFHEERMEGLTMDITRAEIAYKDVAFSFIDVPGHEELIKNMISGASYASTAMLLVSAQKDEGIRDQTKRHLFIAKMLGIDHLVVAVNKMDSVGYKREQFESIKKELMVFIKRIGFADKNVSFVPVSAYKGDNLVKKSARTPWYKGKALLDLLYDRSGEEERSSGGPLRMIVQGLIGAKEKLVVGRIAKGSIRLGERISIVPEGISAKVVGIAVKGKKVKSASVGENIALALDKKVGEDIRGSVISDRGRAPETKSTIRALIFVAKGLGKNLNIKFNGLDIPCKGMKVLKYVDVTTGESSKTGKFEPLNAISAELRLGTKIPAESFSQTRELGRFVLYSGKEFAGMGVVE